MKKSISTLANIRILLLLSIVCFLFHALIAGADDQLSDILDGILKRYSELKGMSVSYEREIITKSMAMLGDEVKSDRASGTILFMPPHYLAIQQTTPAKESVITDGQTIWYYIEAKKTVYEYRADELGKEIELLSEIFSGLSKVGDNFDVKQSDLEDRKDYHLKLVPDPPWEELDHIDLIVEREVFDIRVIEIHNRLGGITRFNLDGLSVRKDLEKKDFTFKAPAGVTTSKEEQ